MLLLIYVLDQWFICFHSYRTKDVIEIWNAMELIPIVLSVHNYGTPPGQCFKFSMETVPSPHLPSDSQSLPSEHSAVVLIILSMSNLPGEAIFPLPSLVLIFGIVFLFKM